MSTNERRADDFADATLAFEIAAKNACPEVIGAAHLLYLDHRRLSPVLLTHHLEQIREALQRMNNTFAGLTRAHAAMRVGETASRIIQAAETHDVC